MRKRVVLIALATALLLLVPAVVLAVKPRQTPVQPVQTSAPLNADTILTLVNNERTKAGLNPLVSDPRLVAIAQARADDMVARNYFAHRDPVTNENMVKALPYCTFVSENLSKVDEFGDKNTDAITGWLNSKPHHDAMLDSRYTLTGIAVNGNIATQQFCIAK